MRPPRLFSRGACGRGRLHGGFTLIELMIGLAIGLFATLVVAQVMLKSEGNKRAASEGSDAQVSGATALAAIERDLKHAGYGFASAGASIGCQIDARFNGSVVAAADFPNALVPVQISWPLGPGSSATLHILASGKNSYSVPLRVIGFGYDPSDSALNAAFPVASVQSVQQGDLMVATNSATPLCEVFQVTANPTGPQVPRADSPAGWNSLGFPSNAYPDGAVLINMGAMVGIKYSVSAGSSTSASSLLISRLLLDAGLAPKYETPAELVSNVVALDALYGKDTDGDRAIDTWDKTTPTNNAQWRQVLAVKVAVAARSGQYEKDAVTTANPLWNVGTAVPVEGASNCGASKCLPLKVDYGDWQHYRYKVFDTVVPLRNALWNMGP
jgi:type IV pilus assembly protein PilW